MFKEVFQTIGPRPDKFQHVDWITEVRSPSQRICCGMCVRIVALFTVRRLKVPVFQQIELLNYFQILESSPHGSAFQVLPDLATCPACLEEVTQPTFDRYRYPLTNCTHCGPRYSIIEALPYDRANTSMRNFPLCNLCSQEFADPNDRRFHAQPIACHRCGPQTYLERTDGQDVNQETPAQLDVIEAAAQLLQRGAILAIQGIGGFHLACDATNTEVVQQLRQRKVREAKPFALMGKNREMLEKWCFVNQTE